MWYTTNRRLLPDSQHAPALDAKYVMDGRDKLLATIYLLHHTTSCWTISLVLAPLLQVGGLPPAFIPYPRYPSTSQSVSR